MEIKHVFVYGTLMRGLYNHHVVEPFIASVQGGVTKGILFDLPYGYPAVVQGDGVVAGELIELNNIVVALERLDELEDYFGVSNPNNLYERVIQEIDTKKGEKTLAYFYIWSKPEEIQEIGTKVADGDWRKYKNKL